MGEGLTPPELMAVSDWIQPSTLKELRDQAQFMSDWEFFEEWVNHPDRRTMYDRDVRELAWDVGTFAMSFRLGTSAVDALYERSHTPLPITDTNWVVDAGFSVPSGWPPFRSMSLALASPGENSYPPKNRTVIRGPVVP